MERLADTYLSRYPTTIDQDKELLKDQYNNEDINEKVKRNSILYRYNEKAALYFIKDCASKADKLSQLSSLEEARKEIDSWQANPGNRLAYFNHTFFPLLQM